MGQEADKLMMTPATTDVPVPKTTVTDDHSEDATDPDDRIYDEAADHILTPKKRRTDVSSASFAAVGRAVSKP